MFKMTNVDSGLGQEELIDKRIRQRRYIGFGFFAILLAADLFATGLFGGSERTLAVVRSIVLPGLPLFEWQPMLGILVSAAAFLAVIVWLRWGLYWLLVLLVALSAGITAFIMPLHHEVTINGRGSPDHSHGRSM